MTEWFATLHCRNRSLHQGKAGHCLVIHILCTVYLIKILAKEIQAIYWKH